MAARSSIKMGRILVLFDLPVNTAKERKIASKFRKDMLNDGYIMLQFSVYMRTFVSWERMKKHAKRLALMAPNGGNIRIFFITEKQWLKSISIDDMAYKQKKQIRTPHQLDLFTIW